MKTKMLAIVVLRGVFLSPVAIAGDSTVKSAVGGAAGGAAGAAMGKKIGGGSGEVIGSAVGGAAGAAMGGGAGGAWDAIWANRSHARLRRLEETGREPISLAPNRPRIVARRGFFFAVPVGFCPKLRLSRGPELGESASQPTRQSQAS